MRIIPWICCGMLVLATMAAAQRRVPPGTPPQRPTVPVTIALKAGADAYQFTGPATCTHAPTAAIYGIVSEQWNVDQSDASRSLHLTLWKPKNAAATMFSLSMSASGGRQEVNTVKAAGAPAPQGSGSVALAPSGNGGTFTVDAKTAAGVGITGTIKCDAFSPTIAEGGD